MGPPTSSPSSAPSVTLALGSSYLFQTATNTSLNLEERTELTFFFFFFFWFPFFFFRAMPLVDKNYAFT